MQAEPLSTDLLIVGAGLAGLTAASHLDDGRSITILDKGRSVGGRLATRRIGDAVLDHGAQFFTVRSDSFRAAVDRWILDGVVEEWCRGFDEADGYPRYRTAGGMNRLAKHVAAHLTDRVTIHTSHRVERIAPGAAGWSVEAAGQRWLADDVLVTSPVPQTVEMLTAGGIGVPDSVASLQYHAVVGLLATLDRSPGLPSPGAIQQPHDPEFTFIADNQAKGISPTPAITFHGAHAWSAAVYDRPDDELLSVLLDRAAPYLGDAEIVEAQVKKWRYTGPVTPHPDRTVVIADEPGRLALAGDAFGGPKVEGAFLSGLAAATSLH